MFCHWCGRELSEDHGYSESGMPICSSFSTAPNKAYNACKARKHRRNTKKTPVANPSASQDALIEALQIIISQNDELIALQRQQANAPKPQLVTETKVISTTTFDVPDFEDDFDIEIKQDKSTKSADNLRNTLMAMYNKQGVWADKPKDVQ